MAGHAVKSFRLYRYHTDAIRFGEPDQIAHARVLALCLQIDFQNAIGILADARDDRVKSVDQTQISHVFSFPWLCRRKVFWRTLFRASRSHGCA